MRFCIICMFVYFLFFFIIDHIDSIDENKKPFIYLSSILGLITIYLCVCGLVQETFSASYKEVERTPIYSIVDNENTNGRFYLGYGSLNTNLYYYYLKDGQMGYVVDKICCDNVELTFRDDNESIGYLVVYQYSFDALHDFFAFGYTPFKKKKDIISFELPKDTIKIDFNIDLK